MIFIKRLILIACLLLLAACEQENIALISIENKVPQKIDKLINYEKTLQIFPNGTMTYYIVYQSNNEIYHIPSITEEANKVLTISINEGDPLESPKMYIYKLSTTEATDTLNLTVNGKTRPFDEYVTYD